VRVVFAGTPEFALPALGALIERHSVVGVLTQPDRPSGRGRHQMASPVKTFAAAHGLPISQPESLKSEAARAVLAAWEPEVLIVVAYGLILPPEVLRLPRRGCLNIHASLLPRWRGAAPVQRAILAGDSVTGVTIMVMDEGLDTGPILLKREIAIGARDTGGSLHAMLAALGGSTLLTALDGLAAGTLTPHAQPREGVTYAAKIAKSEARIDWSRDASSIDRQVRAFYPKPVAETQLGEERLRIHSAELLGAEIDANRNEKASISSETGRIIGLEAGLLLIQCGQGVLGVRDVQKSGGRVRSVSELAHNLNLKGKRLG
jgi:methionyl-tRNA formyltransferase